MVYDLLIVGSGAAGLAAGLYAGRYRMKTLVVGEEFGGLTSRAGVFWNYPGIKGIDGYDLMLIMRDQARDVGTEVVDGSILSIDNQSGCFEVKTKKDTYYAKTIILATGTEHKKLGLANEKEFLGKGVHTCVTCDGPVYTGKTIAVVGGGDASVKGVNLAAEYAKKIYIIIRGTALRAEPINLDQLKRIGDKVEIISETQVTEIVGKEKFEKKVVLSKPYKGSNELEIDGLFIEIGSIPNVKIGESIGVALNEKGYFKVDNLMRTNVPGVFAAGDVVDYFEGFKQDITAAAMGAVAATSAYQYTKVHGNLCMVHMKPVGV